MLNVHLPSGTTTFANKIYRYNCCLVFELNFFLETLSAKEKHLYPSIHMFKIQRWQSLHR